MQYLKPELKVVLDLRQFAQAQYSTVIEIDPGDGCPSLVFDRATGDGTVTLHAEYSVQIDSECVITGAVPQDQSCNGTIVMDSSATYQDNVLIVECSSSETTCEDDCPPACNGSSTITGGEICLDAATVNGEVVASGECVTLTQAEATVLGRLILDCDFSGVK